MGEGKISQPNENKATIYSRLPVALDFPATHLRTVPTALTKKLGSSSNSKLHYDTTIPEKPNSIGFRLLAVGTRLLALGCRCG